jgi:hypothetical protein
VCEKPQPIARCPKYFELWLACLWREFQPLV